MKKIFVFLLALTFVIGISAVSFANEGSLDGEDPVYDTIPVSAEVGQYAEIIAGEAIEFDFEGSAEESADGSSSFTVEANCDIDLDFETTALTNGEDFITVDYAIDSDLIDPAHEFTTVEDTVNSNIDDAQGQDNAVVDYTVDATATLGEISDQAAGSYDALMTITVSAAE